MLCCMCFVVLLVYWLHTVWVSAMTRLLSVHPFATSGYGNQQHICLGCKCENIWKPRWQTSSEVICFSVKYMCFLCLLRCKLFFPTFISILQFFVFVPFDLDFPFVSRLHVRDSWRKCKAKRGNGFLRVGLSMWRTWRLHFRVLFSI